MEEGHKEVAQTLRNDLESLIHSTLRRCQAAEIEPLMALSIITAGFAEASAVVGVSFIHPEMDADTFKKIKGAVMQNVEKAWDNVRRTGT